ncbi:hypothetical protein DUNSADRAFT_4592 [Dunaliella salina]|uniref:Encoded protein n=1 Tax=Dunaliella salina TaxID=3046 RepID=A0ABQ7GRM3_DUNSA|nr:hypothetical protein DUNSADRAFT_4592 [Dunaliella salina]|eukprot:KAF5837265.1 hypothetical protein DUNSADRAFT_4592 [Dunaliella salina]
MLTIFSGSQPVPPPYRSQARICTNIASAELYYADRDGTCYSSRIMYTSPTSGDPSLGYPSHFAYLLRSPGEHSQWSPPTPPHSPGVKVEPLIPERPVRYFLEYSSAAPKDVPAAHHANSVLGMAGVNKQVGSGVVNGNLE